MSEKMVQRSQYIEPSKLNDLKVSHISRQEYFRVLNLAQFKAMSLLLGTDTSWGEAG